MKALIVIEIPDDSRFMAVNNLYDKLCGYKCKLKPIPEKDPDCRYFDECEVAYKEGWNDCIEEIIK